MVLMSYIIEFFTTCTYIFFFCNIFVLFSACLGKFLCVFYIAFVTIKKLMNNKQIDSFVLITRISCDFFP